MRIVFTLTSLFLILYSLFPIQSFTNNNDVIVFNNDINDVIIQDVNNNNILNNDIIINDDNYFVVTAYYSPLPNQEYYLKWNYEAEKRLNWNWIKWASGKWVFSGMLAWPKNYKFWTKIYLEWLWVWVIEDRWWAIVNAWNRWYKSDRIDVWVWYGDEWLRRAIYWGKRKIKWRIIDKNSNISLDYKTIDSPNWVTKNITKKINSIEKNIKLSLIDNIKIDNQNDVKFLQDILKKLWLYDWKIDWIYSKIEDIILKYQVEKYIIKNENDYWAWYFWPKTKKNLKLDYDKYLKNNELKNWLIKKFDELEKISYEKVVKTLDLIWVVNHGEISYSVRVLQKSLKELWYFDYSDTAIFWWITKDSLIKYQIDKKVIFKSSDLWAWVFWPKTKEIFIKDLKKIYLKELLLKEELSKDELLILLEYKKVG